MVLPQEAQLPPQSGLLGSMPLFAAPIREFILKSGQKARTKNAPGARTKMAIGSKPALPAAASANGRICRPKSWPAPEAHGCANAGDAQGKSKTHANAVKRDGTGGFLDA